MLNEEVFLILQILNFRWRSFYTLIFQESFRQSLRTVLDGKTELKGDPDFNNFIRNDKVIRIFHKILNLSNRELELYRRIGKTALTDNEEKIEGKFEFLKLRKVDRFDKLKADNSDWTRGFA